MPFRKIIKRCAISLCLVLPLIGILNLYLSIPAKIMLPSGSSYTCHLNRFTSLNHNKTLVEASSSEPALVTTNGTNVKIASDTEGNYTLCLKLFDKIPLKKIDVQVSPKIYVQPSGSPIGVKLYTEGVLVVGLSYVQTENGHVYPAKEAGIKEGDRILAINGIKLDTTEDMAKDINASGGKVSLKIVRGTQTMDMTATAVRGKGSSDYKLGVWVRDSTAGVGTLSFYEPESGRFASLGHAITDVDTGDILTVSDGSILNCNILSVTKGERGTPGELIGSFGSDTIGVIEENDGLGVYGTLTNRNDISLSEPVEVATRFQIKEGEATILADVDGKGVQEYKVNIQKVSKDATIDNKGIVLKVTDHKLLETTGGIVQGMSGCPILQDGKFIGAVTHVFVNDPTRGYGILAENMIDKLYTIS